MKILKEEKGQALVEFAIIFPILLLLMMGIVQFGMILNSYITIQNAAREGARRGIIGSTDIEIANLITSISPTLNPENLKVNIIPSEINRKSGDTIIVKVTYEYDLAVPIINNIFNNKLNLNSETSMRVE